MLQRLVKISGYLRTHHCHLRGPLSVHLPSQRPFFAFTPTFMFPTPTLSAAEASVIAVAALDDLVVDLVKARGDKLPPAFLDWVADQATPMVEQHVAQSFAHPRFAASLCMGEPRVALARWVCHWISPHIVARFGDMAKQLTAFSQQRPEKRTAVATLVAARRPLPAYVTAMATAGPSWRHSPQ